MIVLVDVELAEAAEAGGRRPDVGTGVRIDLLDTSLADGDAVVLASVATAVQGAASTWLATAELVADDADPRADLTIWVRVAASGEDETTIGDWITMQHVPVDPSRREQRIAAPVRPIGGGADVDPGSATSD